MKRRQHNPDDRLRDLERRARQGDPDARRELIRARERAGHDLSVQLLDEAVSKLLVAANVIDVDENLDRIALRAKHSADRAQHSSTGVDLDYFVTDPWGARRRSTDATAVYVAIVTWQHAVVIGVKRAPIAANSSITNAWPALDPLERPGAFAWPHETSPDGRWIAPGVDSMPDHRVRAYASIVRAWSAMRGHQRTNPASDTYQEPRVPYGTPQELRLPSRLTVSDLGTWPVPAAARAQLPTGVTFYQIVDTHMGYQDAEAELVRSGFGEARSWHYETLGQPQHFVDGEGRNVQRWIRLLGRRRRPDRSIEWVVWRGQDIPPETLPRTSRQAPAPTAPTAKHKMRCRICAARRKSPQCPSCGNFVCKQCSTPSCAFCRSVGRSNPDDDRRRLERLAAQGDAAAQAKLRAIDSRVAPKPWQARSDLARAAVMRVAEDLSGMAWAATYDESGAIDVQPLVQPDLLRLVDGQDVVFLRRGTPAAGGWVVVINPDAPVVAAQFSHFQSYEDKFDAWARDPERRARARSVAKVEGPWFVPHQWQELATNPGPRRRRNPTGRHRGRRTDDEWISLDEVEELFSAREIGNAASRYEMFHGVDPTGARVVQVDDGKPGVERKLVVALGEVPETHYRVPWQSQKFTGDDWKAWRKRWKKGKPKGPPVHWVHHHMEEAMPLEVLDPETGLTTKLFTTPHTQVTDYWRDGECERCGKLPGKCKCQPR